MKVYPVEEMKRVLLAEHRSLDAMVNHYYRQGIERAIALIERIPELELAESTQSDNRGG